MKTYALKTAGVLLGFFTLLFVPSTSFGYSFTPTENEWATWPEFCKARYAESVWGAQSKFGRRVSPATKTQWRNNLGEAYQPLHHYCAGISYMQRHTATFNSDDQARNLRFALGEFGYTFQRVPSSSYLFAEVAINYGLALQKDGQLTRAIEMLTSAIESNPKQGSAYAAMSIMYGKMGNSVEQMAILEKGIAATEGQSAELHYFIGLQLAKQERFEKAREHAIQAYTLGYPLPGLKRRLERAGYSLRESKSIAEG